LIELNLKFKVNDLDEGSIRAVTDETIQFAYRRQLHDHSAAFFRELSLASDWAVDFQAAKFKRSPLGLSFVSVGSHINGT